MLPNFKRHELPSWLLTPLLCSVPSDGPGSALSSDVGAGEFLSGVIDGEFSGFKSL